MRQLKVLDLFSGIGGFSLGLERAGMRTVAFCEIDPYCQRVLRKHWPDVPIYDDIRTLPRIDCDLVCGGFPCQPFSSASRGRRSGTADDRYLWPEMARVIAESRPTWVIGENVDEFADMALEVVAADLGSLGYEVWPAVIPALAVDAPHLRERLFFVGHADCDGQPTGPEHDEASGLPELEPADEWPPYTADLRMDDGFSHRLERLRALGNAVVPQIPELIGRAIMRAA